MYDDFIVTQFTMILRYARIFDLIHHILTLRRSNYDCIRISYDSRFVWIFVYGLFSTIRRKPLVCGGRIVEETNTHFDHSEIQRIQDNMTKSYRICHIGKFPRFEWNELKKSFCVKKLPLGIEHIPVIC